MRITLKTNYIRADSFNGLINCHVNFCICTSFTWCIMANIFPSDVWWPKKTVKVMHDKISLMHLSMVCPRMGGGGTHRKFDIFRFSNVNFHTLGSPLWVKFPPLGRTNIDTHNTQLSISRVYFFLGDEIMVPTISNFVQSLSVEDIF